LKDCYKLEPKLAGPPGTSWIDIEVVSHNVGHRPAREGGARLELERRSDLRSSPLVTKSKGDGGAVIHAYGFGSAG
jgi:D-amino-acid oxidase